MVIGCLNVLFVWLLNRVNWFEVGRFVSFNIVLIDDLGVLLKIGVVTGRLVCRLCVSVWIFLLLSFEILMCWWVLFRL